MPNLDAVLAGQDTSNAAIPTQQSLIISGLEVDARIGVYEHELKSAQPLKMDLKIGLTAPAMSDADDYQDVLCYDAIIDKILGVINEGHINLVETLAQRIATALFTNALIHNIDIRIEKPAARGDTKGVGVECRFSRSVVTC